MSRRKLYLLATLIAGVLSVSGFFLGGQSASEAQARTPDWAKAMVPNNLKPEVTTAVKYDLSPPLTELIAREAGKPINPPTLRERDEGFPTDVPLGVIGHMPDGALQSDFGLTTPMIPSPVITFSGIPNTCNCSPPDPNGDVSANYYVQMFNLHFQIYDKTGVALTAVAANNTIWSGFGGPCQTENAGDPVVLHDQMADRWLLSQFTDTGAPFFNCVAISQTNDPRGSYHRYAFSAPSFPDYPKYGVWPDAYYLNTRESGIGVLGNYALERAEMLIGNPAARMVRFTTTETGTGPNGLLPTDLDGSTLPPAGSPNYFVGTQDNDAGAAGDNIIFYKFHVDWVTTANSTFTGPTIIPVAPFDSIFPCTPGSRDCIPQPGTTAKIDILSYRQRPTFRLAYRNFGTHESLVTAQSVEAQPGVAGMRWYELRSPNTTPVIFQQGTYSPDTTIHRWMGSIAMDHVGNMALGYSASNGTTVFPSIRYTGRLAADPLGTMPQGEGIFINGTGSQTGSPRWGDYTSMNVDPSDDCTFWYTNEYVPTTSAVGWRGGVGAFKFPNCSQGTPTPTVTGTPPTATRTPTATITPTVTNTVQATATICAVFSEGFESGTLGQFNSVVAQCIPGGCGWTSSTTSPHSGTRAAFEADRSNITDVYLQLTSPVSPVAGSTLSFWHSYNLEDTFDGGVIESSTNGGTTWTDMQPNILSGGYTDLISSSFGSPISGRMAWSGNSGGYVLTTVNLTPYAGQSLLFRFRLATDNSVAAVGWNIDDIAISGSCSTGTPPTATATRTNTAGATSTATPCSAQAAWAAGPSQAPARYTQQGAVGSDGNFYVAGGQDAANAIVNDFSRFNSATNTWTSLGGFPSPAGQVSVGASGTKIYVAGGFVGGTSITSTLRIYDIPSNTWTFGTSMPASVEAAAGVVAGGKFYVIGGDDFAASVNTNFIYDIAAGTWTTGPVLPAVRTNLNGTTAGGLVYIYGGADAAFAGVNTLYSFNPGTSTWTTLATNPLGTTNGNYAPITTYGAGVLLTAGGSSVTGTGAFIPHNFSYLYNIAGNNWSAGPNMTMPRTGHAMATLNDGRVIAYSGLNANPAAVTTTSELLPPSGGGCPTPTTGPSATNTPVAPTATNTVASTATNTPIGAVTATPTSCVPSAGGWSAGASMPVPLVRAWGLYFPTNGKFYAMGGRTADGTGTGQLNPLEYTPSTNTWITKTATYPDQQTSNSQGGVLTVGGTPMIVIVGGSAGGGTGGTPDVKLYNPVTDVMTVLATDPWTPGTTTVPGGSAVWNNKLYILGGFDITPAVASDEIWEFDPARAAGSMWVQKSAVLPTPLGYIPAATIGNFIYTGGGSLIDGTLDDSDLAFKYDPTLDTITSIANLPNVTAETRAVAVDGELWVLGGGRITPNPTSNVLIYNPPSDTWRMGPAFVTARRNFPADTDGAGHVYLSGGYAPTAPTDNMEIYTSPVLCGTATAVPTNTSVAPTATNTAVVPTNTAGPTSTAVPTACPIQFADVPSGSEFYSFVRCLACRKVANGYPCGGPGEPCNANGDGYFRPFNNITRSQVAKMVSIAAGFGEDPGPQIYADVPPTHDFYDFINRLTNRGHMGGYDCGGPGEPCNGSNQPYFRPYNNASRGQLSKIVANAAGIIDPVPAGTQTYTDVLPTNPFYLYIERLTARGVMGGYPCGGPGEPCDGQNRPYFRPFADVTRAQGAKIIANTFFPGCITPVRAPSNGGND